MSLEDEIHEVLRRKKSLADFITAKVGHRDWAPRLLAFFNQHDPDYAPRLSSKRREEYVRMLADEIRRVTADTISYAEVRSVLQGQPQTRSGFKTVLYHLRDLDKKYKPGPHDPPVEVVWHGITRELSQWKEEARWVDIVVPDPLLKIGLGGVLRTKYMAECFEAGKLQHFTTLEVEHPGLRRLQLYKKSIQEHPNITRLVITGKPSRLKAEMHLRDAFQEICPNAEVSFKKPSRYKNYTKWNR